MGSSEPAGKNPVGIFRLEIAEFCVDILSSIELGLAALCEKQQKGTSRDGMVSSYHSAGEPKYLFWLIREPRLRKYAGSEKIRSTQEFLGLGVVR